MKNLAAIQSLTLALAVAGSFLTTACDRVETPQEPSPLAPEASQPNEALGEYDRDMLALKATEKDPAKLASGIGEILRRYGHAVPAQEATSPAPYVPEIVETDIPSAGQDKAAASITTWFTVKSFNVGLDFVVKSTLTIPANGTLTITAKRNAADAVLDPVLAAYYTSEKTANPGAVRVKFVGYNDDSDGLNSRIVWTNSTGVSKSVSFISFAFSATTAGRGDVKATCVTSAGGSCGSFTKTGRIAGKYVSTNSNVNTGNCAGPHLSRLRLKANIVGENGALAINFATMKGASIYSTDYAANLDDVLTSPGNLVLGYSDAKGFPCGAGTCYEASSYTVSQEDRYSCPI
jgi:hypothetical protein